MRGSSDAIGSWNTTDMSRRISKRRFEVSEDTLVPSTETSPDIGFSRPRISISVVVLPQPDSPTRPRVSPSRTSNEMPATACTVPTRRLNTTPLLTAYSLTRLSSSSTVSRCSRGTLAISGSSTTSAPKISAAASAPSASVAAISPVLMQAARCSGEPSTSISGGSAVWQASTTIGQRGANGHPGGRSVSDGGWPVIGTSACFSLTSRRGIEPSRPSV